MRRIANRIQIWAVAFLLITFSFVQMLLAQTETPVVLSFEERVVANYLLAGVGKSETEKLHLAAQLEEQVKKVMTMNPEVVQVSSFEEFLKKYQGNWPDALSVQSNVDILEIRGLRPVQTLQGATPEVQAQIDQFFQKRRQLATIKAKSFLQNSAVVGRTGLDLSRYLLSLVEAQNLRKKITLDLFKKAEESLNEEFRQIAKVGQDIASSSKLSGVSVQVKTFLSLILRGYFSEMSTSTKALVASRLMGIDLEADAMKKFEILILSGGPQFQKLLQVIAREGGLNPEVLEIFRKLESKAASAPPEVVKNLIESERSTYKWSSYDLTPLGIGTMAQVHFGSILTLQGERKVVIRFLKPGIEARVDEDHRILSRLAPVLDANPTLKASGFPKLTPIVSDLTQTVREELDLNATIERQIKGYQYYSKSLKTKIGNVINHILLGAPYVYTFAADSKIMVQEVVKGKSLDKMAEKYRGTIPQLSQVVVEEIAKVWIEEVLFRSGFYHADLHQGNYMVDIDQDRVAVSLLDYGMGGTISKNLQRMILALSSSIEILRADLIVRSFWEISDQQRNKINFSEFESAVKAKVSEMNTGRKSLQSMNEWSTWAMEKGLQFPYEFIGLNRGIAILDKSLESAGSKLTMALIAKKRAIGYKLQLWSNLRQSGFRYRDIFKLGWITLTDASPAKIPYQELLEVHTAAEIARAAPELAPQAAVAATLVVRCEKLFMPIAAMGAH